MFHSEYLKVIFIQLRLIIGLETIIFEKGKIIHTLFPVQYSILYS